MDDEVGESAMKGAVSHAGGAATEVPVVREASGQTTRIPEAFEIDGTRAILRRDGDRLIIEPVRSDLLSYLRALDPADRDFPDVDDSSLPPLDRPEL